MFSIKNIITINIRTSLQKIKEKILKFYEIKIIHSSLLYLFL